jgi:hypothetical protein
MVGLRTSTPQCDPGPSSSHAFSLHGRPDSRTLEQQIGAYSGEGILREHHSCKPP